MSITIWIAGLLFVSLACGEEIIKPLTTEFKDGDTPVGIDDPEGLPLDPSAKSGE